MKIYILLKELLENMGSSLGEMVSGMSRQIENLSSIWNNERANKIDNLENTVSEIKKSSADSKQKISDAISQWNVSEKQKGKFKTGNTLNDLTYNIGTIDKSEPVHAENSYFLMNGYNIFNAPYQIQIESPFNGVYIKEGYLNGDCNVSVHISNLRSENIVKDVNVGGVIGIAPIAKTSKRDAIIRASDIYTKSGYENNPLRHLPRVYGYSFSSGEFSTYFQKAYIDNKFFVGGRILSESNDGSYWSNKSSKWYVSYSGSSNYEEINSFSVCSIDNANGLLVMFTKTYNKKYYVKMIDLSKVKINVSSGRYIISTSSFSFDWISSAIPFVETYSYSEFEQKFNTYYKSGNESYYLKNAKKNQIVATWVYPHTTGSYQTIWHLCYVTRDENGGFYEENVEINDNNRNYVSRNGNSSLRVLGINKNFIYIAYNKNDTNSLRVAKYDVLTSSIKYIDTSIISGNIYPKPYGNNPVFNNRQFVHSNYNSQNFHQEYCDISSDHLLFEVYSNMNYLGSEKQAIRLVLFDVKNDKFIKIFNLPVEILGFFYLETQKRWYFISSAMEVFYTTDFLSYSFVERITDSLYYEFVNGANSNYDDTILGSFLVKEQLFFSLKNGELLHLDISKID